MANFQGLQACFKQFQVALSLKKLCIFWFLKPLQAQFGSAWEAL